MADPDIDRALLIADLIEELDEQRDLTTEVTIDLDAVRMLLSETLALVQRQTIRIARQADQIRRLMGLIETGEGWHPPIKLVDVEDVEIPPQMTRASEIRWDGRPPR